jgi:two-component system sensor histidine kinase KdpD
MHAEQAEQQRASAVRLYDLSRAVLLIDQLQSTADQLAQVIREVLQVGEVEIWAPAEDGSMAGETYLSSATTPAERAYLAGHEYDDFANATSCRLLKRGTSITGSITLSSWDIDPLTADAVASLAAIAFERARAVERETHAKLERDAEKLRTAVLDGLAHSFKTPLTAIQTASSGLLALDGLDATQAELVGIIDERATMLNRLTTRLLQTAALEAKQIRLRRTNASMLQLVRKVLGELDEETRARTSISLLGDVADDQMDATLVELALQQLMDNAAKYSTIGSPIEITVNQRESATVVVIENIRDAGSTIRPEERFKIFDRFYRGLDALHGPPGTGLGLSIVKKTAEAHGGHVRLECPDGMTRFVFSICRHSDAEVAHGC